MTNDSLKYGQRQRQIWRGICQMRYTPRVWFQPTRRATSTIAEVIWAISAGGQMYGGIA
jgi:hypothetical protein